MAVIVRDSIPIAEVGNERRKRGRRKSVEKVGKEKFFESDKKKKKTCLRVKGDDLHRSDRCFAETDIDCLFN